MSPHDSLRIMGCTLKQTGPHRNRVELTAAERVLVHLHGFWNVSEPGRESTQAGISEGARLLRSHVPRTLKALQDEGLADSRDTRLRGQRRKIRVYILTEAGVRQARQILGDIDRTTVVVDGRTTTMGEARKALGLTGLAALAATAPGEPESVADAMSVPYTRGTKLLVVDGYGDVEESIVDTMRAFLRNAKTEGGKVLVLAQESTPAYCRFYSKKDIDGGRVVERHLRGLDLEGCRAMLANQDIDADALRRIYLLTKGCPRYLQAIREGDEASLRAHSRFTHAEIRLLLSSGGSTA